MQCWNLEVALHQPSSSHRYWQAPYCDIVERISPLVPSQRLLLFTTTNTAPHKLLCLFPENQRVWRQAGSCCDLPQCSIGIRRVSLSCHIGYDSLQRPYQVVFGAETWNLLGAMLLPLCFLEGCVSVLLLVGNFSKIQLSVATRRFR